MKHTLFILTFLIVLQAGFAQMPPAGMRLISGGTYSIGKDSADNHKDYTPSHAVTVDSFYIDQYEVSNAQYAAFCKETGHKLPHFWNVEGFFAGENYPNHPVVGINYYDALKYAEWCGKRLPTESEWEIAARGGLINENFPNGETFATCLGDSLLQQKIEHSYPVNTGYPNGYQLWGMAGNVWEWTNDWYDFNYYKHPEEINPKGPSKGKFKVIRGGSWKSGSGCCRVFYRNGLPASWVDFAVGFRCAKDVR